jgi:hypothetical protein
MFNHLAIHECLTFINDIPRNVWYRDNLHKIVAGKNVMEIGCGAGLLAAYALEAGAKHYYGIDIRSNRVHFTRDLLDNLGYKGKSTVWTDDFCQLTHGDVPKDIDILLCERTGHQFQNNIMVQQFWQHANKIIGHKYISVPDEWGISVEVYAGNLANDSDDYQPRVFINDSSLPSGYYEFARKSQFVSPVISHQKALSITPSTSDQEIAFTLDLRAYASATVLIDDYISYQGQACNSISATTDWPGPVKITVPDAGNVVKFYWDHNLRNLPNYTKGYWAYKNV